MTKEAYLEAHPGAEVHSEHAKKLLTESLIPGPPSMKTKPKQSKKDEPKNGEALEFGVATLYQRTGLDDDEDKPFVPVHDDDWQIGPVVMDIWEAMAVAIESGENSLLVGPTGCGKSQGAEQLGSICGQPVFRLGCHGQITTEDFLGRVEVAIDPETGMNFTKWIDGILPRAMRRGWWLLLDELDAAPPNVMFVLQGVLENEHKLVLPQNGGEVVEPHPDFRFIATANTLGRGDETGLYAGTFVLNEAFLDRFGVCVACDYPEPETEANILAVKAGIPRGDARRMVECAVRVREALSNGDCYCTFSTRRLVAWATKSVKFGGDRDAVRKAAKLTVTNKLGNGDKEFVESVIQRHFGGSV
jgi:cobaltochelatase CobS